MTKVIIALSAAANPNKDKIKVLLEKKRELNKKHKEQTKTLEQKQKAAIKAIEDKLKALGWSEAARKPRETTKRSLDGPKPGVGHQALKDRTRSTRVHPAIEKATAVKTTKDKRPRLDGPKPGFDKNGNRVRTPRSKVSTTVPTASGRTTRAKAPDKPVRTSSMPSFRKPATPRNSDGTRKRKFPWD